MSNEYEAALAYANELRGEMGLEPLDELPKGRLIEGGDQCPLGRACPGWFFQGNGFRSPVAPGGEHIALPAVVQDFIALFDRGVYPELIL